MRESDRKEFVSYEYKEVLADRNQASFLLDRYESLGWEANGKQVEEILERADPRKQRKVLLRLKRNRKLVNRVELTRLQRNLEACVNEIETLEKSKVSAATIYALILGIVGTAFMAGSTFAVTASPPHILLCIVLAVPGFLGWILPYFVYKAVLRKQEAKVGPLIEEKYDEIDAICEKGNKLLC